MLNDLQLLRMLNKSSLKDAMANKKEKFVCRDFLQIFLGTFLSLLKAQIVRVSHSFSEIYFSFLKTEPRPNLKAF